MNLSRESAEALLYEYTLGESLRKHALGVEACMSWYADHFSQTEPDIVPLVWSVTGLLHDFDYEKYPEPIAPDGHPFKGAEILRDLEYPTEMIEAILGHAHYTNTPRTTLLAKTLFAVDELSGLITASVLVRPDKSIKQLETKSVLKKMKDKAFARGCNRDDIKLGAEELGITLEEHITNCIAAMRPLGVTIFGTE